MAHFLDNYEPVEERIRRFWEDHPDGRIVTHLEEIKLDEQGRILNAIVRTEVFKTNDPAARPDATGYAEETAGISTAPKGSLLETSETSSIGRALANLGYAAKGARPSREEMQKAERHSSSDDNYTPRDDRGYDSGPRLASAKQAAFIADLIAKHRLDCHIPNPLTARDAKEAIDHILAKKTIPPGWGLDVADDYPDEEPF